jgi:hypothetical protein
MFYVWKRARKLWTADNTIFHTEQLVESNWRKEMRSESAVYIIQMRQKCMFAFVL